MIDKGTAARLLDFGARLGADDRARAQLDGAVALYNLLQTQKVAYLADEVGMGKTYVALGALALFRHFQPGFRALVIAPRENIQVKWMKELGNFIAHNVRYPDLRNKAMDGGAARPAVFCESLAHLLEESLLDPHRDFFARLTSFSIALGGRKNEVDPEAARKARDRLSRLLPWLDDRHFDLRNKQLFKDNVARAMCCALPDFDLVIVDEAHNLKHGFSERVAARNRNLGLVFGRPGSKTDTGIFRGYGPRAKRVLFLSATPIEESYTQLWNQLDVFGKGEPFEELVRDDVDETAKKAIVSRFLIRRVTELKVGEVSYTKNLYRREWRKGGVELHDEPIVVDDPRRKLVVALMQKKVSELLSQERFNSSFQIGMLASFESFLETARAKVEEEGNFDGAEQSEDEHEREGIDVRDVNRIAGDHRERFGRELPHPKMDALVRSLEASIRTGKKALVFVRRIHSVKELKRKLDECYDTWLLERMREELPATARKDFEQVVRQYRSEKLRALAEGREEEKGERGADRGGHDTFFAWFFRGEGPQALVSGANIQQRFVQASSRFYLFFEENYVASLLGCEPGEVFPSLCRALGLEEDGVRSGLRRRAAKYLSGSTLRHPRGHRVTAVQAAAIEWLQEVPNPLQAEASVILQERFWNEKQVDQPREAPELSDELEIRTFFTELACRPALLQRLWPVPSHGDFRARFRERQLRAQLLASAARLGHSFIDLYLLVIGRLGTLQQRVQDREEDPAGLVREYLDRLAWQMETPLEERSWAAFDELAEIAANFELILDVNVPESSELLLSDASSRFGRLLREQKPIGGMAGAVNHTLVQQFRMPGYPFILVSTDLLQEGEDLHTFCSSVHHYGISWTPSSMEQRVGRVDRVRSQTDRRLARLQGDLSGDDKLQVYFPHLEDTVEVLQVQRVLERMNEFLRLMHEGLGAKPGEESRIHVGKELVQGRRTIPQILERLETSFPVRADLLVGEKRQLAVGPARAESFRERFLALGDGLPGLDIEWENTRTPGRLLGTVRLAQRQQPFTLLLQSFGSHMSVRCISPVGKVDLEENGGRIRELLARAPLRVCALDVNGFATYDLTVEEQVLLGKEGAADRSSVAAALLRVCQGADRLERAILDRDEPMVTFLGDLSKEGVHG